MKKDLIYSEQQTLWGAKDVIGFGSKDWHVKEIERDLAYEIIIKNHYSKKGDSIAHNKINLGIFIKGELLGVLQYGYAMNPASCDSVVEGTQIDEYLELNRMWLSDKAERNSESKALSYSFRYIRSRHKKIKWIQSFADERCGGLGIVYQASNFNYYGLHVSTFWEIDGEVYHNSILTNGKRKAKGKLENKLKDAKKMELRQFRYIFFIDKRWKKKCLLKEQPYLKYYNGD
jgi:adenine modification enzyme